MMFPGRGTVVAFCGRICKCPEVPRGQPPGMAADECIIGHYRNVRGLGKSIVVFRLFEKLRYSNERSTIF